MKTEVYLPIYKQYKHFSKGLSSHLRNPHDNNKINQLTREKELLMLTKDEMDMQSYDTVSKCHQLEWEVSLRKLKESHGVQNKPIRGKKRKISKTLKRKLVINDVFRLQNNSQDVSDLTKSGIVVWMKKITWNLHKSGLQGCRSR